MNKTEKKEFDKKFFELYDKLVPDWGEAGTLAGELLRAIQRIDYAFYNDGDLIGYPEIPEPGYHDFNLSKSSIINCFWYLKEILPEDVAEKMDKVLDETEVYKSVYGNGAKWHIEPIDKSEATRYPDEELYFEPKTSLESYCDALDGAKKAVYELIEKFPALTHMKNTISSISFNNLTEVERIDVDELKKELWFAVVTGPEDADHGSGSNDPEEAVDMAMSLSADYDDVQIVAVQAEDDNALAVYSKNEFELLTDDWYLHEKYPEYFWETGYGTKKALDAIDKMQDEQSKEKNIEL